MTPPWTVAVASQQYRSASCPSGISSVNVMVSVSFAPKETEDGSTSTSSKSMVEEQPLSSDSSTSIEMVDSVCPVFSTTAVHVICSSVPSQVCSTGASMVISTPKTVLPEPSPAVVVAVASAVPGGGGDDCSLPVAVTRVSHDPSAFCESVTVRVVSS